MRFLPAYLSLEGKVALVTGIANDQSIAYGCAKAMRDMGATLVLTYLNEKTKKYVQPIAGELGAALTVQCDVTQPGELEAVFDVIRRRHERLDSVVHSMAFATKNDLHGHVVNCSPDGFAAAMDVSCHSLVRMAKLAEPLLTLNGGSIFTMTYLGSNKAIPGYNMMGPVKAALESTVRYLAREMRPRIRVHAISPGPIATRAAGGLLGFDKILERAEERTKRALSIDDVGRVVAFLATDAGKAITGETLYVDNGYNVFDS